MHESMNKRYLIKVLIAGLFTANIFTSANAASVTLVFELNNTQGYVPVVSENSYSWVHDGGSPINDFVIVTFDDEVSYSTDWVENTPLGYQQGFAQTFFNISPTIIIDPFEASLRSTRIPALSSSDDTSFTYRDQYYSGYDGHSYDSSIMMETSSEFTQTISEMTSPVDYTYSNEGWYYVSAVTFSDPGVFSSVSDPSVVTTEEFLSNLLGRTLSFQTSYFYIKNSGTFENDVLTDETIFNLAGKRYLGDAYLTKINRQDAATYIASIKSVPIPAAIWFLVSGLLGLVCISSHKKAA